MLRRSSLLIAGTLGALVLGVALMRAVYRATPARSATAAEWTRDAEGAQERDAGSRTANVLVQPQDLQPPTPDEGRQDADSSPGADALGAAERARPRDLAAAVKFLRAALPERFGKLTAEEAAALTVLDLHGAQVSDADLALLAAMPALETVNLRGTQVTDAGLIELRALPNLAALDLRATHVSGAGLPLLPADRLLALHLTDTQVKGQDLWRLPAMRKLEVLKLNGLDVADSSLADLPFLPSLRHLEIDRTTVTSDGLSRLLAEHAELRRIELRDTSVTQEALALLQQQYPEVELVHDSGVPGVMLGR